MPMIELARLVDDRDCKLGSCERAPLKVIGLVRLVCAVVYDRDSEAGGAHGIELARLVDDRDETDAQGYRLVGDGDRVCAVG